MAQKDNTFYNRYPQLCEITIPPSTQSMVYKPKHEKLRSRILYFWTYALNTAPFIGTYLGSLNSISLPNIHCRLLFISGDPVVMKRRDGSKVTLEKGHVYLQGPQRNTIFESYPGGTEIDMVGIELLPDQLFCLLDIPIFELTDAILDFRVFDEKGADILCELLEEVPYSIPKLEQYLVLRFSRELNNETLLTPAISALYLSDGNVRMKDLADKLGITPRTLTRKFYFYQGITPKEFSRILRFKATYENLVIQALYLPKTDLFDIMSIGNYYDQSHMTKEFKHFLNSSPGEFIRRLRNGKNEL